MFPRPDSDFPLGEPSDGGGGNRTRERFLSSPSGSKQACEQEDFYVEKLRALHPGWTDRFLRREVRRYLKKRRAEVVAERLGVSIATAKRQYLADEYPKVYFVLAGEIREGAPVKIGIAKDVEKRLASLRTAHYEELTLLAQTFGDETLERKLHRRFGDSHLRGEWFGLTPELAKYLEKKCDAPGAYLLRRIAEKLVAA